MFDVTVKEHAWFSSKSFVFCVLCDAFPHRCVIWGVGTEGGGPCSLRSQHVEGMRQTKEVEQAGPSICLDTL